MQGRSDVRRELKDLLLRVERGNKADLHVYTSGHLGPHSFSPQTAHSRQRKPIWETSRIPSKDLETSSRLQKSREMEANEEKMMQAWCNFTMASTPQDSGLKDLSSTGSSTRTLWTTGVETYKKKEVRDTAGLAVDEQLVRKQDLISWKRLSVREAVERHERKIQQGLRNVPACRGRCRERLRVFSDVFSDVCDGSPAFGSILREIKTEYDLYLNSIISSQTHLQDLSASIPAEVSSETAELEEAVKLVSLLEEEERRALEENERTRTELEEAQAEAKATSNQLEKEGLGLPDVEDGEVPDRKPSGTQVSSTAQVKEKRRQVWRMWREVQSLQKDLRETMVSTVTTSSLTGFIRDTEAEIMDLTVWNEKLKSTSKDLERNISKSLTRAKVSEEIEEKAREMIWNTVDGD